MCVIAQETVLWLNCGYFLESPYQGNTKKYQQMILGRNTVNYPLFRFVNLGIKYHTKFHGPRNGIC